MPDADCVITFQHGSAVLWKSPLTSQQHKVCDRLKHRNHKMPSTIFFLHHIMHTWNLEVDPVHSYNVSHFDFITVTSARRAPLSIWQRVWCSAEPHYICPTVVFTTFHRRSVARCEWWREARTHVHITQTVVTHETGMTQKYVHVCKCLVPNMLL